MFEDQRLIYRFNRGQQDAFQEIYETHRTDLLKVGYMLLHDKQAAEDVLHDVFVTFAGQSGQFKLKGSLKGYLAICVANRARDWNRRHANRPDQILEPNQNAQSECVEPDPLITHELTGQLETALAELPYEQRETIVLHLLNQLSFKEISQTQKLSINTIMSRYRYGIKKLRSQLNGAL